MFGEMLGMSPASYLEIIKKILCDQTFVNNFGGRHAIQKEFSFGHKICEKTLGVKKILNLKRGICTEEKLFPDAITKKTRLGRMILAALLSKPFPR